VVECGVWHAGPGASAILADLGADVIKVETLTGDPVRIHGRFGLLDTSYLDKPNWTMLFEMSNRNKRSISLNLEDSRGMRILRRLVGDADIFLTNLRKGTVERLGMTYKDLTAVNDRLIYLNVSAYGERGPLADAGGFDGTAQAISGMLYLASPEDPRALQVIILDQMTAISVSHAALTALYSRERDGVGQEVNVSLYGSALWLMYANIFQTSVVKTEINTSWDRTKNAFSRTTFRCGDGQWIMGTNHPEDRYWVPFCTALGLPDLASDLRYATKQLRAPVNEELIARFDEVFAERPRAEWLTILKSHGLNYAPVNRLQDVLQDPQALANDYLVDVEHPTLGTIRIPGYPAHFAGYEAGPRGPAPDLGEHTDAVLAEQGLDQAEIDELRANGVIQ
jgi:crotonobetainyl-CoA:carnitine CoA-transferase CaiB-like acyl-CoA transferase